MPFLPAIASHPLRNPGGGGLARLLRVWPVLLLLFSVPAGALDTIYLVRHAEKAEGWPPGRDLDAFWPLSAAGAVRAEFLASRLEMAGIAAVYASRTTRSLATGLPLANRLRVSLTADDASIKGEDMAGFLARLREKHPADRAVLVVGHSNTIPILLFRLGATADCQARLGIVETPAGPFVEGYDGLWRIDLKRDLKRQGCDAIQRE